VKQDERQNRDDDSQYYLVERTYGEFSRSFTLPSTVDPDTVEADFDNGVLNIHLRKRDAARQRGRQVPITSSGSTRSVGAGDAGTSRGGSQRSTSGAGNANFGSTSGGMVAGSAGEAGSSTGGSASSTSGGGMSASGASSGSAGASGSSKSGSSGSSGSSGRSGKGSGSDSGMSASSGGSSGSSTGGSSGSSGGSGGSGGSTSGGGRS
jgi:hypothetical protein